MSVDASSFSFKYYHGGIYVDDNCSNKKLNHAMLLVGYGSYGDQKYWIVKNRYAFNYTFNQIAYLVAAIMCMYSGQSF